VSPHNRFRVRPALLDLHGRDRGGSAFQENPAAEFVALVDFSHVISSTCLSLSMTLS
jgi:hypothetical protein